MGNDLRRLAWALLLVLLPVALLIEWAGSTRWHAPPVLSVEHAATATQNWPQAGDWQTTKLPQKHCQPGMQAPCFDHYRLTFDWRGGASAVFVPNFVGSLRIAVNGSELALIGSLAEPVHNVRFRPALVRLPSALLEPANNQLQFTLTSSADTFHWLRPFYLGPAAELSEYAQPIIWLSTDANQLAIGIYLIALIFSLAMLGVSRRSPIYIWFALFCLASVLRISFFLSSQPGLEDALATAYFLGSNLQMGALAGMVAFLLWPHRNGMWIWINTGLGVTVFLMLLGMTFYPVQLVPLANLFTNLWFLVTSPLVLFGVVKLWQRERSWTYAWVVALSLGSFALTFSDVWQLVVLVQNPIMQLSPVAPILMVAAFWLVVAEERTRYLSALYSADLEKLDALEKQRREFRRDLHDGVAAQMASLVMMARRKSPELAPYLEENLDDLRRIMDEFDTQAGGVQEIVSDVKTKLDNILSGHGVAAEWRLAIDTSAEVSGQVRQAIYLSLKECVHNALRHAAPTRIGFEVATSNDQVQLNIQDDGPGLQDADGVFDLGRGLAGLQERLLDLQGTLQVHSDHGTCVSITLPMQVTHG